MTYIEVQRCKVQGLCKTANPMPPMMMGMAPQVSADTYIGQQTPVAQMQQAESAAYNKQQQQQQQAEDKRYWQGEWNRFKASPWQWWKNRASAGQAETGKALSDVWTAVRNTGRKVPAAPIEAAKAVPDIMLPGLRDKLSAGYERQSPHPWDLQHYATQAANWITNKMWSPGQYNSSFMQKYGPVIEDAGAQVALGSAWNVARRATSKILGAGIRSNVGNKIIAHQNKHMPSNAIYNPSGNAQFATQMQIPERRKPFFDAVVNIVSPKTTKQPTTYKEFDQLVRDSFPLVKQRVVDTSLYTGDSEATLQAISKAKSDITNQPDNIANVVDKTGICNWLKHRAHDQDFGPTRTTNKLFDKYIGGERTSYPQVDTVGNVVDRMSRGNGTVLYKGSRPNDMNIGETTQMHRLYNGGADSTDRWFGGLPETSLSPSYVGTKGGRFAAVRIPKGDPNFPNLKRRFQPHMTSDVPANSPVEVYDAMRVNPRPSAGAFAISSSPDYEVILRPQEWKLLDRYPIEEYYVKNVPIKAISERRTVDTPMAEATRNIPLYNKVEWTSKNHWMYPGYAEKRVLQRIPQAPVTAQATTVGVSDRKYK